MLLSFYILETCPSSFLSSDNPMPSYFTYILRCADDTLYTGITTDLERRMVEHNMDEKWARYTRMRRPVTLIYSEDHDTRSEASKREYAIKQMTKKEKEHLILKMGVG